MAPMSAAVSAAQQEVGAEHLRQRAGLAGEARMAVMAESAPAMVHATVDVRRTQTPERRADSVFSAIARIARPHVRRPDEDGEGDGDGRRHDEREDVAGLEQVRADVEREVDGHREGAEELLRPYERQHGEEVQHL